MRRIHTNYSMDNLYKLEAFWLEFQFLKNSCVVLGIHMFLKDTLWHYTIFTEFRCTLYTLEYTPHAVVMGLQLSIGGKGLEVYFIVYIVYVRSNLQVN